MARAAHAGRDGARDRRSRSARVRAANQGGAEAPLAAMRLWRGDRTGALPPRGARASMPQGARVVPLAVLVAIVAVASVARWRSRAASNDAAQASDVPAAELAAPEPSA